MNVLAINGSPRKNENTATLLNKALEGAAAQGAKTELVHLYDLNFKGCISCFACKLKDGKSYGKCAVKDDLTSILEKIDNADAIILGSPIYFGNVTGEMRSFMERMTFPYLVYDKNYSSLFKKKIPVGFIYTMNLDEKTMQEWGYIPVLKGTENMIGRIIGAPEGPEVLYVTDTYQFNDYSKYVVTGFDEAHKAKRRKEEFPKDCEKAFAMGARFAGNTK
ncbi:flavodoxin family protein [Desulfosporosinus sp. BG]|uniref:flavodoxin family protein n=1 Tax=Desulfosporosinus sp. BG TaxID=1633135 RepID=UPI00083B6B3A|nr:flavodoxin family protein [Desulfosporosinus sp. BG]ODA41507.1 iron-sulfur flavoprotein [Desulfosporosinus sp. BG]